MALVAGSRLGPFEVVAPLGAGGMGEVFLARDSRVGREVALKVLPRDVATDPEKVARFGREARLLAQLNHPNVAALYEFEREGSTSFLVLEYVPGETLAERLARTRPGVREALETARQVAVALEAAHRRGIVHRDLKPSNVKVTPEGQVKLLDFGLAKALASGVSPARPRGPAPDSDTHDGLVVGTVAYMSPEQARGETVDERTDLWSFGCLLFELLTGRQAFSGSSISDVLAAVLVREPAWEALPAQTPPAARQLLQRCLRKEAGQRPPSAAAVAAEIAGVLSGHSLAAETRELGGSVVPRRRRRARRAAVFVLAVAAVAAASFAAVRLLGRRPVPGGREGAGARVLAVLPFRDLTGAPDGPLVADGLAETLSARLSGARGVQVLTPLATASFRDDPDASRLSSRLGASHVLRGSIQRSGDDVRVAWLVENASGGAPLGGDTQTGSARDLFALQDRVAARVVAALHAGAPPPGPVGPSTASAQERYLVALGHLQRYQDAASVDAAVAQLEGLAAEERDWAPAHAALARAYLARKLVTREPRWVALAREACLAAERIDASLPEVQLTMARLATESGDPEGAAKAFRNVLAGRPDDVEALLGLADSLLRAGRTEEAEKAARRAAAAAPGYWAAHNKLGVVLVTAGRVEGAVAAFRRAVALAPENARGLVNLGSALVLAGRLPEAAETLRKSVALAPTAEGLSALGTVEYHRGRFDEAVSVLEEAVALAPDYSTLWVNLGDARRWSARSRPKAAEAFAKAIGTAEAELRANPRDADARLSLALAYAKTGRAAEARPHLDAALAADPENPDRLVQAAVVEAVSGRVAQAAGLLRRAERAGAPAWQIAADPELGPVRTSVAYRSGGDGARGVGTPGPAAGASNVEGGPR